MVCTPYFWERKLTAFIGLSNLIFHFPFLFSPPPPSPPHQHISKQLVAIHTQGGPIQSRGKSQAFVVRFLSLLQWPWITHHIENQNKTTQRHWAWDQCCGAIHSVTSRRGGFVYRGRGHESVCLFDSSYSFSFFPNSSSISCISPSLPFSFRQYRQAIGLLAQTRQTVPSERLVAGASESDEELVNCCSNTCYSAQVLAK